VAAFHRVEDFVRLFDQIGPQCCVGLLAIPWTAVRGTEPRLKGHQFLEPHDRSLRRRAALGTLCQPSAPAGLAAPISRRLFPCRHLPSEEIDSSKTKHFTVPSRLLQARGSAAFWCATQSRAAMLNFVRIHQYRGMSLARSKATR